jgi:hypothetical protein
MSCNDPIPPNPTREWQRVENICITDNITIDPKQSLFLKMQYKGNILQYKKNSTSMTKNQQYSLIAQGKWLLRKKTYATQSATYTNPNTNSLYRPNKINIDVNNGNLPTIKPPSNCKQAIIPLASDLPEVLSNITGNAPVLPPVPPIVIPTNQLIAGLAGLPSGNSVISNVIENGGSLRCNIQENPCTGKIIKYIQASECYSVSCSDVPRGSINYLCYIPRPLYYPRQKTTMNTTDSKWPYGSKLIR